MSSRNALSLVFALACLFQMGCAGCMNCARSGGGCGMCASCGVPEASCACPDCGCADPCCDVACGCPDPCCEPECCCVDPCCDPCCGVPGCGTGVGQSCPLGTCPMLVGLRNFFCGSGCGCGCGGCGGETYCGDWNCNHACACEPCDQCGNYTGAQYGMPMSRQSHVADRVNADEIRFSATQKAARR
jgi:hypothetical protein